jgi:hypothetical protein
MAVRKRKTLLLHNNLESTSENMTKQLILSLSFIISLTSCSNSSKPTDNEPETILSADREAQIGWVNFDAYADNTFKYSLSPRHKYTGTFRLNGDTLFLTCADSTIGIDTAIIREKSVEFFGKKSPRFASISVNKISR